MMSKGDLQVGQIEGPGTIKVSNKTYDHLKPIVQVWLPALATLYFTLASIWGLPYAEQVVGTIAAFTTFLGLLLGISTKNYRKSQGFSFDGALVVDKVDALKDTYTLELFTPLGDLESKDEVKLEVRNVESMSEGSHE